MKNYILIFVKALAFLEDLRIMVTAVGLQLDLAEFHPTSVWVSIEIEGILAEELRYLILLYG